jgi:transposase-like protein
MDLIDTEVSETQLRASRLIAMGMGYKDVATELDVNRTTLYRWRKSPAFSDEVSRLMDSAREGGRECVVRDVAEVKDLVLDTLIHVARNSTQDSARVSAARTLGEYMERAEERAKQNPDDVMRDQSGEIKAILEHIRQDHSAPLPECN